MFFRGEVNSEGNPHGAGIEITPFRRIQEAYFENGDIGGETKILSYHNSDSNQHRFSKFVRYNWKLGVGYNGYYQTLAENGKVIEEGYQKKFQLSGERMINSTNSKNYGKKMAIEVAWWY